MFYLFIFHFHYVATQYNTIATIGTFPKVNYQIYHRYHNCSYIKTLLKFLLISHSQIVFCLLILFDISFVNNKIIQWVCLIYIVMVSNDTLLYSCDKNPYTLDWKNFNNIICIYFLIFTSVFKIKLIYSYSMISKFKQTLMCFI